MSECYKYTTIVAISKQVIDIVKHFLFFCLIKLRSPRLAIFSKKNPFFKAISMFQYLPHILIFYNLIYLFVFLSFMNISIFYFDEVLSHFLLFDDYLYIFTLLVILALFLHVNTLYIMYISYTETIYTPYLLFSYNIQNLIKKL